MSKQTSLMEELVDIRRSMIKDTLDKIEMMAHEMMNYDGRMKIRDKRNLDNIYQTVNQWYKEDMAIESIIRIIEHKEATTHDKEVKQGREGP